MAFLRKNIDLICVIVSGILLLSAVLLEHFYPINTYGLLSIYIVSFVVVGYKPLLKAVNNIFHGEIFDENFLMSIASIGAFIIGKPLEAVAVMLLYMVGEIFQRYAVKKTRKSIKSVVSLKANFADKQIGDEFIKTPVDDILVGDIIRIKAGDKVALDGVIVDGSTSLNMQALTGESLPVDKQVGDEVLSGSINNSGVILVRVTKLVNDSTATKIIELIQNAGISKSKTEGFVTKFAKYYTPVVTLLAVAFMIIPPLIDGNWKEWVYRALSFLVISCPCAIVISVPLSYFGAVGSSAKKGVLIKGGGYLEKLKTVDTFIFDKTGTLTKGNFEVVKVNAYDDEEKFLEILASVESYSNHPIAKAILEKFSDKNTNIVSNVYEKPGRGLSAEYDGKQVLVGKQEYLIENNIDVDKAFDIGSVVYVSVDKECIGYVVIQDEIKEHTVDAIHYLRSIGKFTVMLTGDNLDTAQFIKNKTGIDQVYANLLPQDKLDIVDKLIKDGKKVCYVGDGINDAPVLKRADVSIAMGNGSDIAIESADIVLMQNNLSKIKDLVHTTNKTRRIILENVVGTLLIKFIVLILSALGITTMWLAIFSDVGVMILAVLNAIRLLK